jgi:hypothetical protein
MELEAARTGGVIAANIDGIDQRIAVLTNVVAGSALVIGLRLNFRYPDGQETGLDLGDLGPIDSQNAIDQAQSVLQAMRDTLSAQLAAL